jgi:hypothetical protein
MSTLWTPGGERPIPKEPEPSRPPTDSREPTEEELAEQLARMQEQLAKTPAEVVIANHAFGLFELAALHLSLQPPQLDQARLGIDALAALVEGMKGRLGEYDKQLQDGLAQLRMAFVQIKSSTAPPEGG